MEYKLIKALGFLNFVFTCVKPPSKAWRLLISKVRQKYLGHDCQNIDFTLSVKELDANVFVNDIEQFSYLFNVFFTEPFRVSNKVADNAVIIDGGANIGMTSLYYASLYPNAKIYAFEPSKQNVEYYKKNLASVNAAIEQKALWDEPCVLNFNFSNCSRYHSAFGTAESTHNEEIHAIRLDDWIRSSNIDRIDILKLNVEGAELKVIKSLGQEAEKISTIVGELHPEFVSQIEITEALGNIGFDIVRLERTGKTVSIFEAHRRKYNGLHDLKKSLWDVHKVSHEKGS